MTTTQTPLDLDALAALVAERDAAHARAAAAETRAAGQDAAHAREVAALREEAGSLRSIATAAERQRRDLEAARAEAGRLREALRAAAREMRNAAEGVRSTNKVRSWQLAGAAKDAASAAQDPNAAPNKE
jgi:hypothetical protein